MAWHRIHHVKSRVRELEESKQKYLQNQARGAQMQGRMIGAAGAHNGSGGTTSTAATTPNAQQSQSGAMTQQQTNGSGSQTPNP